MVTVQRTGEAALVGISAEPVASADDLATEDLARVVDLVNACHAAWIPGEPPMSAEAFLDEDRFSHPPEVAHRFVARDGGGDVVGFARVEWRDGEPGTAAARVFVAPARRREGAARALGAALAQAARAAGRTGLTFEAAEGSEAADACRHGGLQPDMVVEQNRCRVDEAPRALLESWVAEGEATEGYSLVAYDGRCPDALAAGFIEARHALNDAPRWTDEHELHFTVEELRAAEDAAEASHLEWWCVGARHDATGDIVGLTEVYLPRARPWLALQGDTGVVPEHRGHRLGAWMKAVDHLRLRAERPDVEVVQTWNAASNEPMLRINRALGFRPVQRYQGWFLPLT